MRTVTFADEKLASLINTTVIPVWHNQDPEDSNGYAGREKAQQPTVDEIQAYPVGGGGGNVRAYFAMPNGKVFHYVQGYWPADNFAAEVAFATKQYQECGPEDVPSFLTQTQNDLAKRILDAEAEQRELARANPAEFKKPIRQSAIQRKHAYLGLLGESYRGAHQISGQDAAAILTELILQNTRKGVMI